MLLTLSEDLGLHRVIAGMLDGLLRSWKLLLSLLAGLATEQMAAACARESHKAKIRTQSQLQFDRGLGRAELMVRCPF